MNRNDVSGSIHANFDAPLCNAASTVRVSRRFSYFPGHANVPKGTGTLFEKEGRFQKCNREFTFVNHNMIMRHPIVEGSGIYDHLGFFNVHLKLGTRASSILLERPPRPGSITCLSGQQPSAITIVPQRLSWPFSISY